MPQIGPLEILVIFIVALVVFGPSKLPQIGRQIGRGFREFRKFQEGLRDDIEDAFRDDEDDAGREPKLLEAGTSEAGELEARKPEARTPDPSESESRKPDPGTPPEPPPADHTS